MVLTGDLTTLELSDIIQNLEMHRRSGTLVIESERGTSRIYVKEGGITLCALDGRAGLMEALVWAGLVDDKALAKARKPSWRRRRPLAEVLVKRKLVERGELVEFAKARLVENVCDFLALESGTFHFDEGRIPGGVFDPEEKYLELSLAAGPVLFESARRKDHLASIRARVGGEGLHYIADEASDLDGFAGDRELAEEMCELLDGTRSLRELLRSFPERRFACHETLAALVGANRVRPANADDLLGIAKALAESDPARSLEVLRGGLESAPHHTGLLREIANLAERLSDATGAAEALKRLAHIGLENEERDAAKDDLMRACALAPDDASLRERCLELAKEERRTEDAIRHGGVLVGLYRKPGMHMKAAEVLEGLIELAPFSWDLRRDLARSRVDCGNPTLAVSELRSFGKKLLARGRDELARQVMEEILSIVPAHTGARRTIELIDSQAFERRRAMRAALVRRTVRSIVAIAFSLVVVCDVAARLTYSHAERTVSEFELIEQRRYDDAIELFESVRAQFPWTLTAQLTLRDRLEALDAKRSKTGAR